jgi:hypothetical protein
MTLNIQDYPNLEPFVQKHNAKFVGYLLAAGIRRGRARNAAARYATGTDADPPLISGVNRDLAYYYQHLLAQAEADELSNDLYEKFQEKQLRSELVLRDLQDPDVSMDEKRDLVKELQELEQDMERLGGLLEELSGV